MDIFEQLRAHTLYCDQQGDGAFSNGDAVNAHQFAALLSDPSVTHIAILAKPHYVSVLKGLLLINGKSVTLFRTPDVFIRGLRDTTFLTLGVDKPIYVPTLVRQPNTDVSIFVLEPPYKCITEY